MIIIILLLKIMIIVMIMITMTRMISSAVTASIDLNGNVQDLDVSL